MSGKARKAVRSELNPMDKSTIVSILPKHIREVKHTIQPGVFELEPGTYDNPSVLVVGSSSWWRDIDPDEPLLEIPNSSVQVAHSIVNDYANGLFACDMGESMPGLFYVNGAHDVASIKKNHKNLLDVAKAKQTKWFRALVRLSDMLWARSNGNPLAISEDARLAAKELGLDKPWLGDLTETVMDKCPACGSFRDNNFPVCSNCKSVIDKKKYEQLGLLQAS